MFDWPFQGDSSVEILCSDVGGFKCRFLYYMLLNSSFVGSSDRLCFVNVAFLGISNNIVLKFEQFYFITCYCVHKLFDELQTIQTLLRHVLRPPIYVYTVKACLPKKLDSLRYL